MVDAQKCNFCMACLPPCPTGSIDNWRKMPKIKAYIIDEQLSWDELPPELSQDGMSWDAVAADQNKQGRLHLETY